MSKAGPGDVTQLLESWSGGDKTALDRLVPLVYTELRRLAAAHLKRERRDHTLQPTSLVHEAYLRLVGQKPAECGNRGEFFAIAANLMRQILVNYAKRRQTAKRGGEGRVTLEDTVALAGQPELDILALDQALNKLAHLDARQCRIVEMRFFAGMTEEEIANVVGISPITVKREWHTAKLMLHNEMSGADVNEAL